MKKQPILTTTIMLVVFLLVSCSHQQTDDISTIDNIAQEVTSNNSNYDISTTLEQKHEESDEYRDSSQGILKNSGIDKWLSLDSEEKRTEAYKKLKKMEEMGDTAIFENKPEKAWDVYGIGNLSYPSPKVMVKGADAQFLAIIKYTEYICDCDLNTLGTDLIYATIDVQHIQYIIRRHYGLALAFNRYPKKHFNNKETLSKKEEEQLMKKIDCLNQQLSFNEDMVSTDRLNICMDIQILES